MEQAVLHGARRPARLQERDDTAPTAVDQRVFAQLVPPAHALRQDKRRIDCARWRALVTAGDRPAMSRTAADPGRVPPTDTPNELAQGVVRVCPHSHGLNNYHISGAK